MTTTDSKSLAASQTLQYGNFKFTAVAPDAIETDMVTQVLIVVDVSDSVRGFVRDLEKCIDKIIEACKLSPNHDQLHIRVLAFSDDVMEITGFLPIASHTTFENRLQTYNMTALVKATLDGLSSIQGYAQALKKSDYLSNAVMVIITDGVDNRSQPHKVEDIRDLVVKMIERERAVDHLQTILVAVNAADCVDYLKKFREDAKIDQFINLGDVTPRKLAKLAAFVSTSVSSSSKALNIGAIPAQTNPQSFGI